jgi:hypothetical protein
MVLAFDVTGQARIARRCARPLSVAAVTALAVLMRLILMQSA